MKDQWTVVRGALIEAKPIIMLMILVLITLFSIAFIVLIMKLAYSEGFSRSQLIRWPIRSRAYFKTYFSNKMHNGRRNG